MFILGDLLRKCCTEESGFRLSREEAFMTHPFVQTCFVDAVSLAGRTMEVVWDAGDHMLTFGYMITIGQHLAGNKALEELLADCNLKYSRMLRANVPLMAGGMPIVCQAAFRVSDTVAESNVIGDLVISNLQQFVAECEMLFGNILAIVGPHDPRH